MNDKIVLVNSPEYLIEKQKLLDQDCDEKGIPRVTARIGEFEFLEIMTESELVVTVMALMPFVQIEEQAKDDKCKYMVGTVAHTLLLKSNAVMIRVGGGFATLEDHIKQVGPFECIKIYKLMKGNEQKKEAPMSYKEAVNFYLTKHKTPDRIVKKFLNAEDEGSMRLFEAAINQLKTKQEGVKKKFEDDQKARRGSMRAGNISGLSGKASPKNLGVSSGVPSPRSSMRSAGSSPRASALPGKASPKLPKV